MINAEIAYRIFAFRRGTYFILCVRFVDLASIIASIQDDGELSENNKTRMVVATCLEHFTLNPTFAISNGDKSLKHFCVF